MRTFACAGIRRNGRRIVLPIRVLRDVAERSIRIAEKFISYVLDCRKSGAVPRGIPWKGLSLDPRHVDVCRVEPESGRRVARFPTSAAYLTFPFAGGKTFPNSVLWDLEPTSLRSLMELPACFNNPLAELPLTANCRITRQFRLADLTPSLPPRSACSTCTASRNTRSSNSCRSSRA
jgi:hypothetical protein